MRYLLLILLSFVTIFISDGYAQLKNFEKVKDSYVQNYDNGTVIKKNAHLSQELVGTTGKIDLRQKNKLTLYRGINITVDELDAIVNRDGLLRSRNKMSTADFCFSAMPDIAGSHAFRNKTFDYGAQRLAVVIVIPAQMLIDEGYRVSTAHSNWGDAQVDVLPDIDRNVLLRSKIYIYNHQNDRWDDLFTIEPELKMSASKIKDDVIVNSEPVRKVSKLYDNRVDVLKEDGTVEQYKVSGRSAELIASIYGISLFAPKANVISADIFVDNMYAIRFLDMLQNKRVLDVGVGKSSFVSVLRQKGIEAYGLDISLQEEFKSHDYYSECPANETKYPDSYFDVIISTRSVIDYEYRDAKIVKSTLKELLRILRPGGSLLFTIDHDKFDHDRPYFMSKEGEITFFPEDNKLKSTHTIIRDVSTDSEVQIVQIKKDGPAKKDAKEIFIVTLDKERQEIFKNRVLSVKKTYKQLEIELGLPSTTIGRWEEKIRADYKRYLKTGQVPNKYLLVDKNILNDFASYKISSPLDNKIFTSRLTSTTPISLNEIAEEFNVSPVSASRREKKIIMMLDEYIKNPVKPVVTEQSVIDAFDRSLDAKRQIIFRDRVLSKNKNYNQLEDGLGVSTATVARWEEKIRADYTAYLSTGELPNKYLAVDKETLNGFALSNLSASLDKYLFFFRITNTNPETLSEVADKFGMPYNTVSRREESIKKKLDGYLYQTEQQLPENNITDILITDEEIKKVEEMLVELEKINFDPKTIDLFNRYIKYANEHNPNAAIFVRSVMTEAKIMCYQASVMDNRSFIPAPKELEFNEDKFQQNMLKLFDASQTVGNCNDSYKLKNATDNLAKLASEMIVKHINSYGIDGISPLYYNAIIGEDGFISYLENKVKLLPSGENRMACVFAMDLLFGIVEAKGLPYYSMMTGTRTKDLLDTEARIKMTVEEQSKDPVYREKFLFNKEINKSDVTKKIEMTMTKVWK